MSDNDPTEDARRVLQAEINVEASARADLAAKHGQVWNTDEMQRDFEVLGFMAPFVHVRKKSDGKGGSLMFQHRPRFYFSFEPEGGSK